MTDSGPVHAPPAARQGPGPVPTQLLEALDLALVKRAAGTLPGEQRAPGVGSGTELAQLRPYQPGDDVRRLDAAASARTGVAHVRLEVPERLMTTWMVVDVSASMAFGTAARLKSDVAEGVVRVLARLGVRRGGRAALLTCGGTRDILVPPRSGRGQAVALTQAIEQGTAPDGHGDPEALARALDRIGRLARVPGLVAVVSDFRDGLSWERALRRLAARHAVIAVEIRDPREEELPAVGRLTLVDPESGALVEANTSSRRLRERFAERAREERAAVGAVLRRAGATHVVLRTDRPWLQDLGRALG